MSFGLGANSTLAKLVQYFIPVMFIISLQKDSGIPCPTTLGIIEKQFTKHLFS